jgi:glycosyltransferase involved in cell wall biosynthesis
MLIFASYYLPGFKAGGPIRSLSNLIEQFRDEYEFFVITRNHDLGDDTPYVTARERSWVSVGDAKVRYLTKGECTMRTLRDLIREVQPNLLYFNSFLDPNFTIKPLVLRRLGFLPRNSKVIVAPRGEFAEAALALKVSKKRVFMYAAKWCGLYRNLVWQASSEFEARDICRWYGDDANVGIALNLPPKHSDNASSRKKKSNGKLRVVTVARIARNKNIDGALRILKDTNAAIDFNLYGPNEDKVYWQECMHIIENLPSNVKVTYHGELPHDQISQVLLYYDLFFLPTQGENYGHAIQEALVAGLPVLISDRTPWRDLEQKGIGWDLPLDKPEQYCRVLEKCVQMDSVEFDTFCENARKYGIRSSTDSNAISLTRELFLRALAQKSPNIKRMNEVK